MDIVLTFPQPMKKEQYICIVKKLRDQAERMMGFNFTKFTTNHFNKINQKISKKYKSLPTTFIPNEKLKKRTSPILEYSEKNKDRCAEVVRNSLIELGFSEKFIENLSKGEKMPPTRFQVTKKMKNLFLLN